MEEMENDSTSYIGFNGQETNKDFLQELIKLHKKLEK